jgi:hypothetical protein
MPDLLASGVFRMVFEHLQDYFHFEDSASGFPQLFQLHSHITQDHIPPQIACVLGPTCLLTMTKSLGGVCPIVMAKTLYQLTSCILCFQLHDNFCNTFFPTPIWSCNNNPWHQVHPIPSPQLACSLVECGKHLQFNVKRGHISKTSCNRCRHHIIHLFVHAFYAFESPLFYSHRNREGDVTIIPSAMGTHQGDLLGGALFALAHLGLYIIQIIIFTLVYFHPL